MSTISLQGRSVLGLADFTAEEIERILEVAAQMKKIVLSDNKKKDFLKGKSIVQCFPKHIPELVVLSSLPVSIWEPT